MKSDVAIAGFSTVHDGQEAEFESYLNPPDPIQIPQVAPVAHGRVDVLHRRFLREKDPAAFEAAARHAQPPSSQDDTLGARKIGVVVNHLDSGLAGPPVALRVTICRSYSRGVAKYADLCSNLCSQKGWGMMSRKLSIIPVTSH